MKNVTATLAMGLVLATTSAAHAGSEQGQQVAECKTQLTAVYGADTHVRVIGKASVREPVMTFSVHPRGERHLRVSCTRTPDGGISMMDRYGIALAMPEQQGSKVLGELF